MKRGLLYFSILLLVGCGSGTQLDTPTSGTINISADDEYKPLVDAELTVFQALYTRTKIMVHYESEDSIFRDLMNDSARLIVTNRTLTQEEENYFHSKQLFPEQARIATDGLALIVNKDCYDTLLTYSRIKDIFSGKDTATWNAVVFDHANSGNSRYILTEILHGTAFPKNCFAVNGNMQVIDYVSKNKNALGIIGVNWISDGYDSSVIKIMRKVNVIAISEKDNAAMTDYYHPYPENFQTKNYPLTRDIYIISREARTGLGSGFLSFVTADKGQRIVYTEGLLPASMPTHIMHY